MKKIITILTVVLFPFLAHAVETTSEMVGSNLVVTITLSPTDQAWMENDLMSLPGWIDKGVKGKMRKCRSRMISHWDEILRNDPAVEAIPTSQVAWLQLVTVRPDYYNRLNREMKTVAERLVQRKIANLVALGYEGLPASNSTTTEDYNSVTGYEDYKRVFVLEVDTPSPGTKTITVTVYWQSDDYSVSDSIEL